MSRSSILHKRSQQKLQVSLALCEPEIIPTIGRKLMKKLFIALLLVLSSNVFSDDCVTIDGQMEDDKNRVVDKVSTMNVKISDDSAKTMTSYAIMTKLIKKANKLNLCFKPGEGELSFRAISEEPKYEGPWKAVPII